MKLWGGPSSAVSGVPVGRGAGTQTQREEPVRTQKASHGEKLRGKRPGPTDTRSSTPASVIVAPGLGGSGSPGKLLQHLPMTAASLCRSLPVSSLRGCDEEQQASLASCFPKHQHRWQSPNG